MSIQAVGWALDQELPARPKLVLVAICNHANHIDGYCWLKAETIAAEAACTPRSVYRFVGALIRNGYLRKAPRRGEDGKQRATDYWVLFNRIPKLWEWSASTEPADDDAEPQDIAEPDDTLSPGEEASESTDEPVDKHVLSCGPADSGVTRHRDAEPSKSNPKDARASEPAWRGSVPRRYNPPPEQPQGAIVADRQAKQIFVFTGTRAWDAWLDYKLLTTGLRWSLSRKANIDGKWRDGWWFPSLFPPEQPKPATGPPKESLMTQEDEEHLERTGTL